ARDVEQRAGVLERDPTARCDVERAALLELVGLEVGEVQLDRPAPLRDVEVQVVLAPHVGAWPHAVLAVATGARSPLDGLRVQRAPRLEVATRESLHRNGHRPPSPGSELDDGESPRGAHYELSLPR